MMELTSFREIRIAPIHILKRLKMGLYVSDSDFDGIFPARYRHLSRTHWTPVRVAITAARFACSRPGARILDIGSGVGKFCIVGALSTRGGVFHGVEQRGTLVSTAKSVAKKFAVPGVAFFHANAAEVDWSRYSAVYLYNPFWENLENSARIDDSITLDKELLVRYVKITKDKLSTMSIGSRAIIFNGFGGTVPGDFELIHFEKIRELDLAVWEKK